MFGMPCAFVQGQMFAGLYENSLMMRLSEEDRQKFLETVPGAAPFSPMPGRTMREYVEVPPVVLDSAEILEVWLNKAYAYAMSLPPKVKKERKKK
jgi:TfoX/Sxy family transcriptional regulator of competence genes